MSAKDLLDAVHSVKKLDAFLEAHPDVDINQIVKRGRIRTYEMTALQVACKDKKYDVVERLLAREDIDPNRGYEHPEGDWQWSPLAIACKHGDVKVIELLLAHPAIDVNRGWQTIHGEWQDTPLLKACEHNRLEIVQMLLAHPSIDVNKGKPLVYASRNAEDEIADALLAAGAVLPDGSARKARPASHNYGGV